MVPRTGVYVMNLEIHVVERDAHHARDEGDVHLFRGVHRAQDEDGAHLFRDVLHARGVLDALRNRLVSQ